MPSLYYFIVLLYWEGMFSVQCCRVVNLELIPKPLLPPLWVNIRFLFIFKLNIIYGFVSLRYGLTRDTRWGGSIAVDW